MLAFRVFEGTQKAIAAGASEVTNALITAGAEHKPALLVPIKFRCKHCFKFLWHI